MKEQRKPEFKEVYQIIRFKTYQMGSTFMENDVDKICTAFQFNVPDVKNVLGNLNRELKPHINYLQEKYREKLNETLGEKNLKICCVGDSFVSDHQSFFQMLKILMSNYPNVKLIDAAVTSETSTQLIAHIHKRVLVYQPDIVIVLIGTNDMRQNNDIYAPPNVSISEYKKNLEFLASVLHQCGSKVIFNTLPPYDTVRMEQSVPEKCWTYKLYIDEVYNNIIRDVAEKYQLYLNDMAEYFKEFTDTINIPNNGLHLTEAAHCYFADKLLNLLLTIL